MMSVSRQGQVQFIFTAPQYSILPVCAGSSLPVNVLVEAYAMSWICSDDRLVHKQEEFPWESSGKDKDVPGCHLKAALRYPDLISASSASLPTSKTSYRQRMLSVHGPQLENCHNGNSPNAFMLLPWHLQGKMTHCMTETRQA